jgi:hypothetical protein
VKVEGNLIVIGQTVAVSEKFSKREIVVQTLDQYPQSIAIQFSQDKCGILDQYKIGDNVEVAINLRGREWTSPTGEVKYFNTIEGWKINKLGQGEDRKPLGNIEQNFQEEAIRNMAEEDDDLPF